MAMNVAASGDTAALAIRDHVLPIMRERGTLEDRNNSLRLLVLEQPPWQFRHWTPFNALAPGEAASPGYRHALARQHTRPDLSYGLDVWHEGVKVLSLLWADTGAFEIVCFVRGPWEAAAMAM